MATAPAAAAGSSASLANKSSWSERHYLKLLPKVDHLPEERQRAWLYYSTFPNLAFDIYPDQIDYFQIIPVAPGKCYARVAGLCAC